MTSPKWAMNFARGCGGEATPNATLLPGPVAMFGSPQRWTLLQEAIAEGREWFYGDHAYFRRSRYYRITRNRYQHDGVPTLGRPLSPHRLRECGVDMQPHWQKDGDHVIVCPNSPTYMKLFGIDAQAWAADVIAQLTRLTDRPIRLRWKAQATRRPLYVDLDGAYCVIVFSSNAAVEGLAAGVPCITLADFAASRRMGRHRLDDIENLYYPDDREVFLMTLAQNQWTMEEMARGDAWKVLRRDH